MVVKYVITIVVMLFIMLIQYKHYHHILAAPVIYPVMWIFAFIGLIIAGDTYYEVSTGTCIVFVAGYVLFSLGFRVAEAMRKPRYDRRCQTFNELGDDDSSTEIIGGSTLKSEKRKRGENGEYEITECEGNTYTATNYTVSDQRLGLNIVTAICVLTGLVYAVILFKEIDFKNFYHSVVSIRTRVEYDIFHIPYILTILRFFIRCSLWYLSLQLFRIPKDTNYKDEEGYNDKKDLTIRILIILASSAFIVVADLSRNDILFTFLPVLFIYIISRKLSDAKILSLMLVCLIIFSAFFVWFTDYKRGSLGNDFNQEDAKENFIGYLSGSLVALDVKRESGDIKLLSFNEGRGAYTFSLINSIMNMIFRTKDNLEVIRERRYIGPSSSTNVYTVYEWTGMDFGILYALFWQFVFGILYGVLYFGALKQRMCSIFWYSALSYSLVMMFFQDQFFSIAQSWLIIIVICYGIFFICNRAAIRIRGTAYSINSSV